MVPGFRGDGKYARSGGLDGRSAHPLVKATRRRSASGRRMAGPSYGGFSENPVEITRGERSVHIFGRALRGATHARPGETHPSPPPSPRSAKGAARGPPALGQARAPVRAARTAGRGGAAHAGVDHAIGVALAPEPHLEPRGIRLVGRDAPPGGQAVAERDDDAFAARRGRDKAQERDTREREPARAKSAHAASVV